MGFGAREEPTRENPLEPTSGWTGRRVFFFSCFSGAVGILLCFLVGALLYKDPVPFVWVCRTKRIPTSWGLALKGPSVLVVSIKPST